MAEQQVSEPAPNEISQADDQVKAMWELLEALTRREDNFSLLPKLAQKMSKLVDVDVFTDRLERAIIVSSNYEIEQLIDRILDGKSAPANSSDSSENNA